MEESLDERRDRWEAFLKNQCWLDLCEVLKGQKHARTQKVMLTPLTSTHETLETEFMKGEYAAFGIIEELPNIELEAIKSDIEARKRETEDDKTERK